MQERVSYYIENKKLCDSCAKYGICVYKNSAMAYYCTNWESWEIGVLTDTTSKIAEQ